MAKLLLYSLLLAGVAYGINYWWGQHKGTMFGQGIQNAAGGQLIKGQEVINKAKGLVSSGAAEAVQQVVNAYKAETGSFPASLQELLEKGKLTDIPGGITYDPATGTVSAN